MTNLSNFKKLWLSDNIIKALQEKWFEKPTEIQEKTIPLFLSWNKDIIWQAQTWTGKTASFWLPLLEMINENDKWVQAIILTPTRELAIQVTEEINSYKWSKKLKLATIYWWQSLSHEFSKLKSWVHIVIWTPWRIIDHLGRKSLDIWKIKYFVLDEADEMLNMWFIEDIENILKSTPKEKKMLFFSATMPKEILNIAKKYMREYDVVSIVNKQDVTNLIEQIYFQVNYWDKFEALSRIIDIEDVFLWIIFCRTKNDVDTLTNQLQNRWYNADWLHWDIKQSLREKILNKLKDWKINILVATDVAARWIDINNLTHVINYSLPWDSESYTHRIWRTWRAWKTGTAITFVTPDEYRKLFFIQKDTKNDIKKEKLPSVSDVLENKKQRIIEWILNNANKEDLSNLINIAKELLKKWSPENIIAWMLKTFYKNELEPASYRNINENNSWIDNQWITRLFIARWKRDWMNPRKIIKIIKDLIKIDPYKIENITVMDEFSFLNMPFLEAEQLLNEIKKTTKYWSKPLIVKAKKK